MGGSSVSEPDDTADAIWKPGYTGPAPVSAPSRERPGSDRPDDGERAAARRRGGPIVAVAGAVVVALVGAGAWVAVRSTSSVQGTAGLAEPEGAAETGAPPVDGFAGADPDRLPASPTLAWSRQVETAGDADVGVEVVGDRHVLLTILDPSPEASREERLEALDAESGEPQWSVEVDAGETPIELVAAVGEVAAFVVDGALVGFDLTSGARLWESSRHPVDPRSVEFLAGSSFVAVATGAAPAEAPTSILVDVATGQIAGSLDGEIIGTDRGGRWFVRRGGDVLEYDLSSGYRSPDVVSSDVQEPIVSVVGGTVVASGPNGWRTVLATGAEATRTHPVDDDDVIPAAASGITAVVGDRLVLTGAGRVVGAELDGSTLRPQWGRRGIATVVHPTLRGAAVLVALDGGARQRIIDGATGETVVNLSMAPGVLDSVVLTGNGVLVKRFGPEGRRLAAFGLDGEELWALDDVDSAAVGDRVVVTTVVGDDGAVTVDAFADRG